MLYPSELQARGCLDEEEEKQFPSQLIEEKA
jgi:hypothetical protein